MDKCWNPCKTTSYYYKHAEWTLIIIVMKKDSMNIEIQEMY
jgi:hypothetical protein